MTNYMYTFNFLNPLYAILLNLILEFIINCRLVWICRYYYNFFWLYSTLLYSIVSRVAKGQNIYKKKTYLEIFIHMHTLVNSLTGPMMNARHKMKFGPEFYFSLVFLSAEPDQTQWYMQFVGSSPARKRTKLEG